MEEDELLNDELKMPSDLEGNDDEEESEDEGLFPEDPEGPVIAPDEDDFEQDEPKAKKSKLLDSDEDEDKLLEKVFKEANDNNEMDIVGNLVAQKDGEFIN